MCSDGITTFPEKYYHNGNNTLPQAGDTVFTDSDGSTVLGDGFYIADNNNKGYSYRIAGGNGIVATTQVC